MPRPGTACSPSGQERNRAVTALAALFPDSIHVFDTGLARFTSDEAIWEFARNNGFVIVTADSEGRPTR